ncbi:MAG: outer membrane protein assembly factor BamB family protein [Ktedonobacterales bacterium]
MRRITNTCWVVLTVFALALTACSGTTRTSARSTTTTTTQLSTPTPKPASPTVYLGAGSTVYAFDARTGSQRWKYDTGQPAASGGLTSIREDSDTVFFKDSAGLLNGLDAATGAFRWKLPIRGVPSGLTVVSGVVYVTNSAVQYVPSTYAIDLRSGTLLWQISSGGAMAVTNDAVYLANALAGSSAQPVTNGFVRAYDRLNGKVLWQVEGHPYSGLQLGGSALYTAVDNTLYAYDAHSGAKLWTKPFDSTIIQSQLVGTTLYLGDRAKVIAFDVTTQQVLWQFAVTYGYVAIGDTTVCVANRDNLFGLNITTGVQAWSLHATSTYAAPTYSSGTCYADTIGGDRATLYAVDAATGKPHWNRNITYLYDTLRPTADAIYVLSQDTAQSAAFHLIALSTSDGSPLWTFASPSLFPGTFVLG